MRNKANKSETN